MKTQNAVLLSCLKNGGKLTAYYCIRMLGIGCPTKRISELRIMLKKQRSKHKIETIPTKLRTRWGKSTIATWVLK